MPNIVELGGFTVLPCPVVQGINKKATDYSVAVLLMIASPRLTVRYNFTVTNRKVAGMEVLLAESLLF